MAFGDRKKKKYRDFAEGLNGEIIYNGELFNYSSRNTLPYSAFRQKTAIYSAAAFAAIVLSGTFAAPGTTNRPYIILPILAAIVTSAMMCYSAAGILSRGEILRKFDMDGKFSSLKGTSAVSSFFSAAAFLAYSLNFFFEGRGEYSIVSAIAFPVLTIISFCSAYSVFRLLKDTVWQEQK